MTEKTTAPPAAPTTTPAAKAPAPSRTEQFAAAMKEFDTKTPEAKASEAKAPEAKEPAKAPEAKEPTKAPEGIPDPIKASFDKLAQEKASWRKEQEAVKPYVEALKVFSPVEARALAKARSANDPLAALSALGFSYADVVKRMVDTSNEGRGTVPAEKTPPAPAAPAPELEEMRKELADMRAWKAQRDYETTLTKISTAVKDRPLISKLGEERMVLDYLTDFVQRTGKPPGDTFEESVSIAAEAVEQHLAAQAKRFSGLSTLLTAPPAPATVPEGVREPPAGSGNSGQPQPSKTITNADVTPRTDATKKSRDDLMKELANDPNWLG